MAVVNMRLVGCWSCALTLAYMCTRIHLSVRVCLRMPLVFYLWALRASLSLSGLAYSPCIVTVEVTFFLKNKMCIVSPTICAHKKDLRFCGRVRVWSVGFRV